MAILLYCPYIFRLGSRSDSFSGVAECLHTSQAQYIQNPFLGKAMNIEDWGIDL